MNKRLYLVERPSVAQALTILDASKAIAEGDEDSLDDVRKTCREWLPRGLASVVLAKAFPVEDLLRIVNSIVISGAIKSDDEESEGEKDLDALKKKAEETSWFEIIGTYADAFSVTPSAVLAEPWPLFTAMTLEIDKLRARDQITQASWYASAKTGKMDDIVMRAKGERKTIVIEKDKPPEWYARQREAIRVFHEERRKQGDA